jgi:hypothetical protein
MKARFSLIMKYYCGILIILFLLSCSNHLVSEYTAPEYNRFQFDKASNKYHFVELRELSFHKYSEGKYIQKGRKIYLQPYGFDSCITYKVAGSRVPKRLEVVCGNYDKKFRVMYYVNGKSVIPDDQGSLYLDSIAKGPIEIFIKLPYPKYPASYCYYIHDSISTKILLDKDLIERNQTAVNFMINYNYFNWVPWSDSLKIVNRKKLKSMTLNEIYRKEKSPILPFDFDYLHGCLFP